MTTCHSPHQLDGRDLAAPGAEPAVQPSFSNPSSQEACSFRMDDVVSSKLTLLGRYNYLSSSLEQMRAEQGFEAISASPSTPFRPTDFNPGPAFNKDGISALRRKDV